MPSKIDYHPDLPLEIKEPLDKLINKWNWICPPWLKELSVVDAFHDDSARLSITTNPEYRSATLFVGPSWIRGDEQQREDDIVHELLHIIVAPLSNFGITLIDKTLGPDAPVFESWAKEQHRLAIESVMSDLQHIMTNKKGTS